MLGFAGSHLVVHHLAEEDCSLQPMRAFMPWAVVCLLIGLASLWLMFQPMELRATMMGGCIPKDLDVRIGVQPVGGRLAEVV
jgi:hypothetical protein